MKHAISRLVFQNAWRHTLRLKHPSLAGILFVGIQAMVACWMLGTPQPAQAAIDCWKDGANSAANTNNTLEFVAECCDSLGLLKNSFTGVFRDPFERFSICVQICNNATEKMWQTQYGGEAFEEMCCGMLTVSPSDSPQQDNLEKKCEEASFHTGSEMCTFKKDRPDGVQDCCILKETENTVEQGKPCKITDYAGRDDCKADSRFLCCLCKDPNSDKGFYIQGSFNCRMCRDECKNKGPSAGIPEAVPNYHALGFNSDRCGETRTTFEGPAKSIKQVPPERRQEPMDMFCFTAAQCAEASGNASNYKPGMGCPMKGNENQGYCRAPEPDYELQYPILGVKVIKGLRSYIGLMFKAAIGLIIVLSATFFVWGAFKYLISSVASTIERTKQIMVDSLVGLVLGLGSYALLANINAATLQVKTLEINMVNRMSFFNVVFCKDITPPRMLADAGTVMKPKSFSEAFNEGFTIPSEKADCGKEYFIEGADSTGLCSGDYCKSGGCISCAGGVSTGCKTTSYREFACADGQMVGTIVAPTSDKMVEIYGMLISKSPVGLYDTHEVDRYVFPSGSSQISNTGSVSGQISAYKFQNITNAKLDQLNNKVRDDGYEPLGLVLLLRVDPDYFVDDIYYVIAKPQCTGGLSLDLSYTKRILNLPFDKPVTLTGFLNDYKKTENLVQKIWTMDELDKMSSYTELQKCNLMLPDKESVFNRWKVK